MAFPKKKPKNSYGNLFDLGKYQLAFGKNVAAGQMYAFDYKYYQHDKTPLALFIKFEDKYDTYAALNFHYIHPDIRVDFFKKMYSMGDINEKGGLKIDMDFLKRFFNDMSVCYRRYKMDGIMNLHYVSPSDFLKKHHKSLGDMPADFRTDSWTKSKNAFTNIVGQGKQ